MMSDFQFPEKWALSTLDKSVSADGIISDGDWVESKDQDPNGSVRLIQLADIGDGDFKNKSERFMTPESAAALNCTFLKSGDVLIARMPDPLGRACIFPGVGQKTVTVVDICLIRTGKVAAISNKLLTYWINSPAIRNLIAANASGTTRKRITRKKLEKFEFPLPPLAEQKVIAQKLDTLLAQVETTKARLDRIPDILKRFRQSVLAAAVSGKLTEEWRKKNSLDENLLARIQCTKLHWVAKNGDHNEVKRVSKRVEGFSQDTKAVENLPKGWYWGQLEDCVLMIVDCHNKTAPYVDSGIPLIRTTNVREGEFVWNKLNYVNQETYEYWSKRCPPEGGDIIFTREAPMGEAAIIPPKEKYCLGQRTMLIRPIEALVPASYILLALMDPLFKRRSEEFAVGTGVKHFRVGDVSKLLIPLPPTEEQTQIVKQVETLFAHADAIEQQVQAAQSRVNSLTQSILAKAFRGELTAEWRAANPELISGDNSAEALLAKIQAEREAEKPKKKTRVRNQV